MHLLSTGKNAEVLKCAFKINVFEFLANTHLVEKRLLKTRIFGIYVLKLKVCQDL